MRICMLTSAPIPPREGIGFYVWNLSCYLQRAGHSMQIITRGTPKGTRWEDRSGIPVWKAGFAPLYPLHVHVHSILVNRLLGRLASEFDILHAHTPLVRLPKGRLPSLVTVHTPLRADIGAIKVRSAYELLIKLQAPLSYALERELLQAADTVVAVSSSVAGELRDYRTGSGPVKVLGNAVDVHAFQPGGLARKPAHPYVLSVGRLAPRKGLADLVQAAGLVVRAVPDMKFYIAGSGPLESQLRRYINACHLEGQIVLLGHVSDRACLVDLYRGASAFVHPATYEGLPTVLLEAMACGCPVVATAVSGALDVIEPGVNGFLAPPSSPHQLAEAILACLDNPVMSREFGLRARKTIEKRFSWEVVGGNYLDEYRQLLARDHS